MFYIFKSTNFLALLLKLYNVTYKTLKSAIITFLIIFSLLISGMLYAVDNHTESEAEHSDSEFNVTEVIMHHIQDSHSWHLWTTTDAQGHEHDVSIPLPVILFYNGHLDVFLSSAFHHGETPVTKGDRTYVLHHEKIYVNSGYEQHGELHEKPLDFSITRNATAIIISALILLFVFISVAKFYIKNPNSAPKGLAGFMEPVILFVRDEIAVPNIGKRESEKYMVYLLTVFFFILLNNLLGLVPIFPGASNVTGNIAVTMTLALFTLIITNINGTKDYWKHIFATPGVPIFVLPILILVEIIGIFTKPFALMVRLFANITAGHIIILSLVSIIFIFKSSTYAVISVPFGLFMSMLEILVAFLQAFIFTMLSALFIGMAVQKHH